MKWPWEMDWGNVDYKWGSGMGGAGTLAASGDPGMGFAGAMLGGKFGKGGGGMFNKILDPLGLGGEAPQIGFTPREFNPYSLEGYQGYQDMITAQAKGEGPSVAQEQLKAGIAQAERGAYGQARSQRGTSGAAAARIGAREASKASAAGALGSAQLRAKEMLGARQQLGGFLQGTAGLMGQQRLGANQLMMKKAIKNMKAKQKKKAGILGAAGGALGAMFSDKKLKTNVKPLEEKNYEEFAKALKGYKYDYKDKAPIAPDEKKDNQFGIMAQDLEKSKIGKSLVNDVQVKEIDLTDKKPKTDTHERKMVDTRKLAMALAATTGHLYDKVQKLENQLASNKEAPEHERAPKGAHEAPSLGNALIRTLKDD